jgi:hypothetical protein
MPATGESVDDDKHLALLTYLQDRDEPCPACIGCMVNN